LYTDSITTVWSSDHP